MRYVIEAQTADGWLVYVHGEPSKRDPVVPELPDGYLMVGIRLLDLRKRPRWKLWR